jgi:formate dehydrogenase maturation protein FdhE
VTARAANQATWDDRVARARALIDVRPAATELLTFYAALAGFQKSLLDNDETPAATGSQGPDHTPARFFATLDIERVLDAVPRFLRWLPRAAPEPLADSIDAIRKYGRKEWHDLVRAFADGLTHVAQGFSPASEDRVAQAFSPAAASADSDPLIQFILECVLQPFAEQQARRVSVRPNLDSRAPIRCPRCGAPPVAAVLREEGQSAKRFLLCALCLIEWECLRILCPSCGEQSFEKLPIFTAEQFAHVRVDACDRCRHYVKTIDLTKDGLAVPYVDDIASVSLDLWARERDYIRLKRNVLGL